MRNADQVIVQTKNSENNYNLLRVICTIAVIFLHVSSAFFFTDSFLADAPNSMSVIATYTFHTITRFAVPCFLLLSGAFLLDNDNNQHYSLFYRKKMIKIFVPTIIFTIIYFLLSIIETAIGVINGNLGFSAFITPLKKVIIGAPYYHMWYMYTLLGIYLLIPLIIKLKLEIGEKAFSILCWIYFLIAVASGFTTSSTLNWGIPEIMLYLGYVLVGYQIRKKLNSQKNNKKAVVFIFLGFLILSSNIVLRCLIYQERLSILTDDQIYNNFFPITALSSVLIFVGFSYLNVGNNKILTAISKDSYIIYLVHALILSILLKIVGNIYNPLLIIPLETLAVFFLSWIFAVGYNKLWKKLDRNEKISGKICNLLHL